MTALRNFPTSCTDKPEAFRGEAVEIRLSEAERIDYQKAAERSGMSLLEWIHDRLNEAVQREAKEG